MQKIFCLHYHFERCQRIYAWWSRKVNIDLFRSLHDSICVAKRTLESGQVVAGGGAVDVALSIYLEQFSKQYSSKEQIAISEFSEALNVIPKTLSTNAAKDAT